MLAAPSRRRLSDTRAEHSRRYRAHLWGAVYASAMTRQTHPTPPPTAALGVPRLFPQEVFVSFWTFRIGEAAALARFRGQLISFWGFAAGLFAFPLLSAGISWRLVPITVGGVVAGVGGFAAILAGQQRVMKSNEMAATLLGNPGGRRYVSVPSDQARYEAWCDRFGLAPYSASRDAR